MSIKPYLTSRLRAVRDAFAQRRTRAELLGRIAAVDRVQAVIEFTPAGEILDANDNFLRAFGYTREQVVGQHHCMFVDPAERESEEYQAFWQRLGEGHHDSGLYRRLAADGREVWIQGSYSPVRDAIGRVRRVVKHATDVTAQRLQAADMQGRLDAIDRAQAVITFDLDGVILAANDNFLAALGYRREEVIGQHHRMFVERTERESPAYRQFWERLRRGEYNAALYKRVRRDGSPIWIQASYNPIFDAAGRPLKVVKYATDVTRQTLAAQALRNSLEQLNDTVPAIAGDAQNANRLAREASGSAGTGGVLVDELVSAIADINERARAMAEIIAVIDSIAFQTNILAINAAVEAAHAGELGKGFGVVAQEVRALAQRSAQSSKEIRALVQNTADALAGCSSRAQRAGAAMQAITGSSAQVDERIRQIAEAARAQADGLAQVSRTLSDLQLDAAA
ncbi:methyl-accepting chemotaxis protein [Frateuria sp. GZRR35]|uniref:methyl-accepting chemotaxis protein n=1 Tax=unclassified Frateuria TaxID=2648894 RepID=UPI003EDBC066